MVDISSASVMIAAGSVVAGAILALLEIRNLVKARRTDMVLRLYSTYASKEFREAQAKVMTAQFTDYEDVARKYNSEDATVIGMREFCLFFEGVGVLLHRKLIDIDVVDDLFSSPIIYGWERVKPFVGVWRKELGRPQIFEWFEYLYSEMQKRERKAKTGQRPS